MSLLKNKRLLTAILIIIIFPVIYLTQFRIDGYKSDFQKIEDFAFTPPAKILTAVSLNQKAIIADILWLKVIQYIGEKQQSEKGWKWFYHNINVITDIDPDFSIAYQFSGLIFSIFGNRIDESISILKKGVKNNPDNWYLYFLLGYNYFYELKDYQKAAFYIERASFIKGSPAFLKFFTTRLYSSAGSPENGIIFTESLLNKTTNEDMREKLLNRLKILYIERDLNVLNYKISEYEKKYGTPPSSLGDIVKRGLLNAIPEDPFGKKYFLDRETGKTKSLSVKETLKVFRRH